jgi:hypothetical protein
MNTEEFEKQLQEQPMRAVPGHWRMQILQTARKSEIRNAKSEKRSWLNQLLWPCPQAWGTLAAIWVVVFTLNYASTENEPQLAASSSAPSRDMLIALKQQGQLRAELLSSSETPVAEAPKWPAPHSRVRPAVQIIVV